MWKYLSFLFSLAFVFAGPAALGQEPAKAAPAKLDYSKEAAVIEQLSSKLTFENDGTGTREVTARIRVQSDAGVQSLGVLVFSYASRVESLAIDYVRVRRPDGVMVITSAENIQDMPADITRAAPFYSDLREKHVAVKGLGAGDVLEYMAHWQITKPLAPGQFWYAYNFTDNSVVLKEQLEISVPVDRAVKWSSPKFKPVITENGTRRVFTWTTSNLKTKPTDEDHILEIATGTQPPPDVEISSFQSWDEVGRWYGGLQKDKVQPSLAVQAKATELTKGAADQAARIQAIYHYVSTQFHYIGVAFGIGRYQPHSAGDVLDNQYGDCKDKHTLLASLLQAAGITAYPALINSSHKIDPDVPSPAQFDHVITAVPQGKNFLWLDTTTEIGPFGYLVTPLRNKPALVILGDDKQADFVDTVAQPPFPSSQVFTAEGKLSDTGVLNAKMEETVRGDSEVILRAVFRSVSQTNWKALVQNISYRQGFGGTVSDVTGSTPEATESAFHFGYSYERNDYSDWGDHQITPPLPPIYFAGIKDDQTKFTEPLWLGAPSNSVFRAKIQMPKGYTISSLPADVDVERDFAEYHSSYKNENGTLIAERRFVTKLSEVPVGEFKEFKSFEKAVQDDQSKYVVLSQSTGRTPQNNQPLESPMAAFQSAVRDLPESTNPEASRLLAQVQTAMERRDFSSAIASLKESVAADPKYTRGWIMLGSFLMMSGQPESAVQALHSAIAANPQQPAVYKAVGLELLASNKAEEAIPILQKLSELTPDDLDAKRYLGRAYLAAKRYPEAASTLESAVKLNAKDAGLYDAMGTAYLRAGDEEKAASAYKNALALNSSSEMLNDIAYEMAEANKDLSQALQYAQQAVQMEEEASAKVQLANLKVEDLTHTASVGAFWDTLGWVYFRMNNLILAEKYLHAAWMLGRNPVEADHLGQVYEQEHRKNDAIKMDLAALASVRPPDSENPEIKKRLKRLAPRGTQPQTLSGPTALRSLGIIQLSRITSETASAEFFLLFSRDPKTASAKLEDLKFISGSQRLRSAGKTLAGAHFQVFFPDDGPTRLVRRGIVGCYQYSGCTLFLYPPDSVHSVD